MRRDNLAGKVAFITGAASGIGLATTLRFVDEGARVIAYDRDAGGLAQLAEKLGDKISVHVGDTTDAKSLDAALTSGTGAFGHPDILVNSAAIVGKGGAIETMSEEDWDELYDINVKGTFLAIKAVAPGMLAVGRGSIVNMGSTAGLVGSPALGGYSSTKGAIVLMSRSLAVRYAPQQVRVNCVCPGSIDTPQLTKTFETAGPDPSARKAMADLYRSKQPLGRFGRPEEVAAAILFLASDESSFITGAALPVDGGRIA